MDSIVTANNGTCGFSGNSDIYGLGIRIGYYTQAVAAWFSNFFLLREANSLRSVNNLFLFALVIVGMIYAFNASTTYAVEAFLLLQIGLCLAFVSILEASRYSTRYIKANKEHLLLKNFIAYAAMSLNIGFWWFALDHMLPTPCGTFACYVVRTDIYGWMRTVMKTLSILMLLSRLLVTTLYDIGKWIQSIRMSQMKAEFIHTANSYKILEARHSGASAQDLGVDRPKMNGIVGKSSPKADIELGAVTAPNTDITLHARLIPKGSTQETSIDSRDNLNTLPPDAKPEADLKPKDLPQKSIQLTSKQPTTKIDRLFESVYQAEKYLKYILAVYPDKVVLGKKSSYHAFGGCIHIYIPQFKSQRTLESTTYFRCLWHTFRASWINEPPRKLRSCLWIYLKALQQHSEWHWPRFVSQMIYAERIYGRPDWHHLALACDTQLSQMPLIISPGIWAAMAVNTVLVNLALIVQVELTIAWNDIHGLQNLTTVGQLIPFVIGVGGLVKVLWGKWSDVRRGKVEKGEVENREKSDYEMAMETYLKWREQRSLEPENPVENTATTAIHNR